jgi:hypothetical protein
MQNAVTIVCRNADCAQRLRVPNDRGQLEVTCPACRQAFSWSPTGEEGDPESAARARSLLDRLLADTRLYSQSKDYRELLEFVARLRNFAPFNAMLLQIQKPGLTYAASPVDWRSRFGRTIKPGARPLLILWPFGPVALVFDVIDTEGVPLPEDAAMFPARGPVTEERIQGFKARLAEMSVTCCELDAGDAVGGSIRMTHAPAKDTPGRYLLELNRNHQPATRFATIAHELAHLFLGHLGADRKLQIPDRADLAHVQRELEAESVAYLVCERNGVRLKSQTYLAPILEGESRVESVGLYEVMRAAGRVEATLGPDLDRPFSTGTRNS